MAAVDKVIEQVLALSVEDQQKVFDTLAHHGPPGDPTLTADEWNAAWTAELERRLQRIESGEARYLTQDEVMTRLRSRFAKKS